MKKLLKDTYDTMIHPLYHAFLRFNKYVMYCQRKNIFYFFYLLSFISNVFKTHLSDGKIEIKVYYFLIFYIIIPKK